MFPLAQVQSVTPFGTYYGPSEKTMTLVVIFTFALAVVWVITAAGHKARRLKLLEDALASGALDQQTKREMVNGMLADAPPFYVLGWLGLFVSGAGLLTDGPNAPILGMHWQTLCVLVLALSLGAVTLPFAARELHGRRRGVATRSEP